MPSPALMLGVFEGSYLNHSSLGLSWEKESRKKELWSQTRLCANARAVRQALGEMCLPVIVKGHVVDLCFWGERGFIVKVRCRFAANLVSFCALAEEVCPDCGSLPVPHWDCGRSTGPGPHLRRL